MIVISRRVALQSGGVSSKSERQGGVAVHDTGVSTLPAQREDAVRRWRSPALGAAAKGKQTLRRMPDGTRGRYQGSQSRTQLSYESCCPESAGSQRVVNVEDPAQSRKGRFVVITIHPDS